MSKLWQRTPIMTWIVIVCVAMNPVAQAQDYRIPELGGETDWRRQIRNNPPLTERQWLERSQPMQPYCPPCNMIVIRQPVWVLIGWDYHPAFGIWTPRYQLAW